MKIYWQGQEPINAEVVLDLLRAIYGEVELLPGPAGADLCLYLSFEREGQQIRVQTEICQEGQSELVWLERQLHRAEEDYNGLRRICRLALLEALLPFAEAGKLPWGVLTGIRPTKIVHRMLAAGYQPGEIRDLLQTGYGLTAEKAGLLLQVALSQRPLLARQEREQKRIGIYIGIPFCPTKCLYCSFPSYPLARWQKWTEPVLAALLKEMAALGEQVRELGLTVESIYVGGGTPTSLDARELRQLMTGIEQALLQPGTEEFTVEAGRPDTINREKLQLLRAAGVNRISINPQTMNEATLQKIGRAHTPEQVVECVRLARQMGFPVLNMDLIIGLPGEGREELEATLASIRELAPENLTVHTLALKRASLLAEAKRQGQSLELASAEEAEALLARVYRYAGEEGLEPYYLYRQKQMVGALENVGFAVPGKACLYNIQMIEERQTILGLGAGAGSKWVRTDYTLVNTYNPKDPIAYLERIDEVIVRKKQALQELFG
ncbi:MAG: coproporphyrinogen dehydrogenase HemZ [Bacillota bacterium]